jgi:hypothetical protein
MLASTKSKLTLEPLSVIVGAGGGTVAGGSGGRTGSLVDVSDTGSVVGLLEGSVMSGVLVAAGETLASAISVRFDTFDAGFAALTEGAACTAPGAIVIRWPWKLTLRGTAETLVGADAAGAAATAAPAGSETTAVVKPASMA